MASIKLHEFYCKDCDALFEALVYDTDVPLCPLCLHPGKRRISFRGTITVFKEHYNEGLGMHITGANQLRDQVKRAGLIPLHPGDRIDLSSQRKKLKQVQHDQSLKSIRQFLQSGNTGIIERLEDGPFPGVEKFIEKEKGRFQP